VEEDDLKNMVFSGVDFSAQSLLPTRKFVWKEDEFPSFAAMFISLHEDNEWKNVYQESIRLLRIRDNKIQF
jgi:hypothetical protein